MKSYLDIREDDDVRESFGETGDQLPARPVSHHQTERRARGHLHPPHLLHVDPDGSAGVDWAVNVVSGEARHLAPRLGGQIVVGPHEGEEGVSSDLCVGRELW